MDLIDECNQAYEHAKKTGKMTISPFNNGKTCDNCYWYMLTGRQTLFPHYECIKDFDLPEQTKNGKTCELYEKNR